MHRQESTEIFKIYKNILTVVNFGLNKTVLAFGNLFFKQEVSNLQQHNTFTKKITLLKFFVCVIDWFCLFLFLFFVFSSCFHIPNPPFKKCLQKFYRDREGQRETDRQTDEDGWDFNPEIWTWKIKRLSA